MLRAPALPNQRSAMLRRCRERGVEDMMAHPLVCLHASDRLAELLGKGDNLERVKAPVDFEMVRPALEAATTGRRIFTARRDRTTRTPLDYRPEQKLYRGRARRGGEALLHGARTYGEPGTPSSSTPA